MRGRRVITWHPDSPGSTIIVWRPWWKRKAKPFATLNEAIKAGRWTQRQYGGEGDARYIPSCSPLPEEARHG